MPKEDLTIFNMDRPEHVQALITYIRSLQGRGPHAVTIHRVKPKRSAQQNAWLHGVAFPRIAKRLTELWGDQFDMLKAKEWVKSKLLRTPIVNSHGELVGEYIRGTHELDTMECSRFMEQIMTDIAQELEMIIPAPGEYDNGE